MKYRQLARSFAMALACVLAMTAGSRAGLTIVTPPSLIGQDGYIDIQLNPIDGTSLPVTATILTFDSGGGGALKNNVSTVGNVTGTLDSNSLTLSTADTSNPSSLSGSPINDYYEGLTFGAKIVLDLTLTGPGVGEANGGSTFTVSFYDANNNLLPTSDPSNLNTAAIISVNADGSVSDPIAFQIASDTATPEPSTLIMAASGGLMALGVWWHRRAPGRKAA